MVLSPELAILLLHFLLYLCLVAPPFRRFLQCVLYHFPFIFYSSWIIQFRWGWRFLKFFLYPSQHFDSLFFIFLMFPFNLFLLHHLSFFLIKKSLWVNTNYFIVTSIFDPLQKSWLYLIFRTMTIEALPEIVILESLAKLREWRHLAHCIPKLLEVCHPSIPRFHCIVTKGSWV